MEIEKQRGISVTSTVLSFEYKQYHLNLLDTPGHQDFSEDTYRTLAAADNCVMLVDGNFIIPSNTCAFYIMYIWISISFILLIQGAKGIEDRTRKLFEVCRMRQLPVFTFANKMDRYSFKI